MKKASIWIELTNSARLYQAEMLVQVLEDAGIPALIQGPQAGVFGFGFGPPTPQGISVRVPAEHLEEAKDLLEGNPPL